MKPVLFATAAIFAMAGGVAHAQSSQNVRFVTEYIRQLGNAERIRSTADKEMQGNDVAAKMATCIRSSTAFQYELQTDIGMLKNIKLSSPFDRLVGAMISFYEHKSELYQEMSKGCEAMLAGPRPGVDYGAISANAPKLTATLEYVDKAMFDATPMVFASLIDPVPDSKNQMSKLIVTKAEREKLISDINLTFGNKLDKDDQNYTVATASVLRSYLLKNYTSSNMNRR
jgi:hypothetical protein